VDEHSLNYLIEKLIGGVGIGRPKRASSTVDSAGK
jgi:hypothetical protein